jgi:hypothetical protein
VYSEELDLDGSDMSSEGRIEPGEPEENDLEGGRVGKYEYKRREPRTRSEQSGAEQRSVSGNRAQDNEEHEVNNDEGYTSNSEDKVLQLGNSSSLFWRWGPSATSDDAVKFFQRVL